MALLTGVALVSYIAALNLIRVVPGQPAHRPQSAPRPPRAAAQHALPLWHGRPVVPQPRPPFGTPPSDDVWGNAPW
jgi:hypothetical protein